MLFCTKEFFLFFLVVFTLYWTMPWKRARVYLLLAASFYFYASWSFELARLIVISTTIDYLLARGIESSRSSRKRKLLLTINIVGNLSLLCYFKYANFFLDSLKQALTAAGYDAAWSPLNILLPIGISFYTFEAISYMVDVYHGKTPAEKNLAHFQLFILFFPHLVAGPIVRGRDFLPQVGRGKRWSWPRMQVGVQLFLLGVFKKLAIADRMAQFVDPVFKNPELFGTSAVWVAAIAYALQIYCDFSGYTDMALGIAHMLGYKLNLNFNMPYLAVNVSDFWRRWHISLSSWLRDYLFIPLGGSRGTHWKVCRNLMITMALGGLWHGTNWTFVVWGILHGAFLIVHRFFRAFCEHRLRLQALLTTSGGTLLRCALTFLCVLVAWVFFRAETFGHAAELLRRMFIASSGQGCPLHSNGVWLTVLVVALAHILTARGLWQRWAVRLPAPALGAAYALLLTVAQILAPATNKAFIYFQF